MNLLQKQLNQLQRVHFGQNHENKQTTQTENHGAIKISTFSKSELETAYPSQKEERR